MSREHSWENVANLLGAMGMEIPEKPHGNSQPGQWLVRAESNPSRFETGKPFEPTSGAMGKHGVFLGDNGACLMKPNPGLYYIFNSARVATDWLIMGSEAYKDAVNRIAGEHNLDLNTLHGGLTVEEEVYRLHATYDPITGIATVPNSLSIQQADLVIATGGLLDSLSPAGVVREKLRMIR